MIVLSSSNLSKAYIVDYILKDISFTVESGDKIGVIGNNGSGKTTLLDIISGQEPKTDGELYLRKDFKIGYLEQHTNIESEKTIYDECMEAFEDLLKMEKELRELELKISSFKEEDSPELEDIMNRYSRVTEEFNNRNGYAIDSEIKGTLKGLGFKEEDLSKEVNILSGGQKSRLSLAKLLLQKPDILLLDEPTNHLDIEAINWLELFLNDYKGACLIISHDRYFLDNVVNRIFLIENSNLKIYNTDYSRYMRQRKKDLEVLKKQFSDQQKEIERQKEIIERFSNYGGSRYIKQAQARQKLLDKIDRIEEPTEAKKTQLKFTPKVKSGRDVLAIEDVSRVFEDGPLFENASFNIYRGEKVGLIGGNGVGKTSLFKMILGQIPNSSGEIHLGHKVNIGYFDQEQTNLDVEKTVLDEIWDDNPHFTHYQLRSVLSKFLFVGDDIFKEIKDLSGGERGRLALLKMMLSDANFLLMDEPTNHLDIDSKEILEDALNDYEGTLLVISHDRYFLNSVAHRIIELTPQGSQEFLGNYDYYIKKKKEAEKPVELEEGKTKTQIKLDRKKEKELKAQLKKEKKALEKLEAEISELELAIEEYDSLLCQENIYSNPDRVLEVGQKREENQAKLDLLYEEWIEVTEE